uniref:Uncharacterized protein n=1 Tax=Ananas comosus var. bracteatus TaxID=296719 RepID=A0A6V7Q1S7_ANACO|nr:unnamed protein product [Ananas comosus var. bracteatus]
MRRSVAFSVTVILLLLLQLLTLAPLTVGSLLTWLDRPGSPVPDRVLADPFRILEQVPFALDRDDVAMVDVARVDWRETPTSHEIIMDVPGIKREELKIEIEENRILRVNGERRRDDEKKGEHWHCIERSYGKFWRRFRLPDNADLDSVTAKLEDGVLTVSLKKLAPDQIKGPRLVSIGGGESEGEGEEKKKKITAADAEKKVEL